MDHDPEPVDQLTADCCAQILPGAEVMQESTYGDVGGCGDLFQGCRVAALDKHAFRCC